MIKIPRLSKNNYIAISSTYREDPWNILEWLEYHILIGVDHFFIYNNDPNPEQLKFLMKSYIQEGYVSLTWSFPLFNKMQNKQRACHNDALIKCKAYGYKWMAMLDSDEFIYPMQKDNLKEVMKAYEDKRAICINYANFGSSGLIKRPEMQINSYLHRASNNWEWNELTKAIGQSQHVSGCDHHHKFSGPLFDEHKIRCRWTKGYSHQYLRINHYMARSREDFMVKMARGNPLGEKRDWNWFNWADRNEVYDDGISKRFGKKVKDALCAKGSLWRKSAGIIKFQ